MSTMLKLQRRLLAPVVLLGGGETPDEFIQRLPVYLMMRTDPPRLIDKIGALNATTCLKISTGQTALANPRHATARQSQHCANDARRRGICRLAAMAQRLIRPVSTRLPVHGLP